ncbi:MAG: DUF885 domain-containing protein [Jatrophihabitantaceae bacterium]
MSVRKIADRLLAELAPVDPVAAEALGREPDSLLPALSPADFDTRRSARERALRGVRAVPTPATDERVLAAALTERLSSEIALDDAGFTRALLAPLATPVHEVRAVFDNLPHETPEQWARVGAHLAQVPVALADYADTLRAAAADGHVVAARQVLAVAAQCEAWTGADDFYRRLVAAAPSQPGLAAGADAATEATARFAGFLRTELLPSAPERDAVGRERYTVTARAFLGEDVDLDETYAFGWDELARLTAEMRAVAADLGADSIEQAAAALDADPAQRLAPDALAGWLQARVDEVTDAVDGVHFELPPIARRAECRISAATSGVMYYAQPDAAFARPGRIWWSPPAGGAPSYAWREVTTVHHEGVPGHHLQITVAMAEPELHPWQRSMAHVHGYVEGWAHYAERLSDELGLLRTPGERLGMLYGQRWRAARIVIDLGLHLGLPIPAGNGFTVESTWTPELGAAVLRAASGTDEASARFEVDRYFGWPAQALSFRVGARLWRQVREAAERRPGFDRREFHMRALRLGPMGLGPLRDVLIGADDD